jgi:hypothetical protein
MLSTSAQALLLGGAFSAAAAVAHLACIVFGVPAYRFMGAGERMARAVDAGSIRPTVITFTIATILFVWALYAFAGAGVIGQLPLTNVVLSAISLTYLARVLGFPLLRPMFPENSLTFWLVSSGICLLLGLLYAVGTIATWPTR